MNIPHQIQIVKVNLEDSALCFSNYLFQHDQKRIILEFIKVHHRKTTVVRPSSCGYAFRLGRPTFFHNMFRYAQLFYIIFVNEAAAVHRSTVDVDSSAS